LESSNHSERERKNKYLQEDIESTAPEKEGKVRLLRMNSLKEGAM
jgi:hypothetical protein